MTTSASILTNGPETARATAHAPGKLILSGEHSILYNAPAIAMAIAEYTEVSFRAISPGEGLRTVFENLSSGANYPLKILSKFKSEMDTRFEQFKRGELAVHKILTRPDDLAVYTLASLLNEAENGSTMAGIGAVRQLPHPGELNSRSDLPIGAGLGSSAAIVASTTVLFEMLLNRPKTLEDRYERVRFCERLKHGKAGPIDAATVVRGGLVQVGEAGVSLPTLTKDHSLWRGDGWYWVLHGRPESSTGECVWQVRESHGQDAALWAAFAACTNGIAGALAEGGDLDDLIRENQRLLERIGVVPAAAQSFVRQIEAAGGAAKICGAGSVKGASGGAILVHMPEPGAMEAQMARHPGLRWSPLRIAQRGAARGPAPR